MYACRTWPTKSFGSSVTPLELFFNACSSPSAEVRGHRLQQSPDLQAGPDSARVSPLEAPIATASVTARIENRLIKIVPGFIVMLRKIISMRGRSVRQNCRPCEHGYQQPTFGR